VDSLHDLKSALYEKHPSTNVDVSKAIMEIKIFAQRNNAKTVEEAVFAFFS